MQMDKSSSPRITHIAWGEMCIEGVGSGKDFKLWPGGGRSWDWAETGTRHSPGIRPDDVAELLWHGCTAIVLSKGMQSRLQIRADTLDLLRTKGVDVHVEPTLKAVEIYNALVKKGIAVGGLFHSTC